jgi:hypothetical protein
VIDRSQRLVWKYGFQHHSRKTIQQI